ncbi:hypothetical protein BH10CHL1_BH10CHL1_16500 [soil metagenome]
MNLPFTQSESRVAPVGADASMWTTHKRLLVELQALSSRITAVNEIAVAINRTLDLDEILGLVGRHAKWLLDFDYCGVCLRNADDRRRFVMLFGEPTLQTSYEGIVTALVEQAINTKQSQLMLDDPAPTHALALRSQLIIPMESEGEILGTLQFASTQARAYNHEDLRIGYLLALQLTGAIRNARRFEEINLLYAQLEKAYAAVRGAEVARDQLLHMIVHDLRNPLTTINFSLNLLDKVLNPAGQGQGPLKYVQRAQRASQQVLGMVDELLDVNKLDDNELQPNLAPVDFAVLLHERVEIYRSQANFEEKRLALHLPDHLPLVMADRELIHRVFDHLLANALKYTGNGDYIEVRPVMQENFLYVYIRDSGAGVPMEEQERFSDGFAQMDDATNVYLRKGTGINLTFCRLVIRAHKGNLWIESTPNQGNTFIFTLPIP